MHLVELLSLRAVPAAGVSIGITRRCPLHCDHCSTSSTMDSEQAPARMLTRFVDSFTPTSHPLFMAMSGGEALLRPRLVRSLALKAREAGTRSSVLSGLFFASNGKIPPTIKAAIDAVDHFSASIDQFHEREVPRAQVFKVLGQLLDEGKDLSLHIAGEHADDPYLDDIVQAVQQYFGQRIPMLINTLSAFGRAKSFIKLPRGKRTVEQSITANPCTMAAWPVVGFDGIVAACGNDNLIGNVPRHLRLGDVHRDSWAVIEARVKQNSMLKALRIYGPEWMSDHFAQRSCKGYCDTCIGMGSDDELSDKVDQHLQKSSLEQLEQTIIALQSELGPLGFARRFSHPRFAPLVMLGSAA